MKKKILVMGILAVMFLAANLIPAQAGEMMGKGGSGLKDRIAEELKLTPEQQNKLNENRSAQRQELQKLVTSLNEKQAKLREALKNPAATRVSVEPLVTEVKAVQSQMVDSRVNGIFAVKSILTPEQFVKFQQISEERRAQMKKQFLNKHDVLR